MNRKLVRFGQLFVIALLALVIVSNLSGALRADEVVPDAPLQSETRYPSLYLAPSAGSDGFFDAATLQQAGMRVVPASDALLKEWLDSRKVRVLYIDPAAWASLDEAWLRQALAQNVVLVAIDTQMGALSARTGVPVESRPELAPREGMFVVSILADLSLDNPPYNSVMKWQHNNHYNSLAELHIIVSHILNSNLAEQEGKQ